ncbi:hypothetical protein MATL_G00258230 [Megalops atlanticus]|uniref:Uncharacterized protein n=1 Tax=Megalops atlanticus TaxID=7932 RepID=A0A9D3PBI0_MEGAT|nr:hypothetical protein MATL_G00258230 [Megalops atlanticus]
MQSSLPTVTASSEPAAMRGVTAHEVSQTITLYTTERAGPSEGGAKPLLLLFPWLGSRPRAVAKYCEPYLAAGFDVLVVESGVSQFLWPRWGLGYAADVLEVLQSDGFASRPLLVHALSIGGYTFTQLLVHVSQDARRYRGLTDRIRGQIYDSLVCGSLEQMAVGVGQNVFPWWEGLVRQASLLYFRVFKSYTVDYFNAGVDVFLNSPVTAPALFFYCENDELCDLGKMEEVIECWRRRGVAVQTRKWAESTHAANLHHHPEEYLSALDNFLQSLGMTPSKANAN